MKFIKRHMAVAAVICAALSVFSFYFKNLIPLFAFLVTAVILIYIKFFGSDRRLLSVVAVTVVMILSIGSSYRDIQKLSDIYDREITAVLTFLEDENPNSDYVSLNIKAEGKGIPRGTKLNLTYSKHQGYRQGDRIKARIVVRPLEDNKYLPSNYAENVFAKCKIKEVEKELEPQRFGSMLSRVRGYVTQTLFDNLSHQSAATVNALVTGERTFLSDGMSNAVKYAGVSHIMVVSGLHLSIIMGALGTVIKIFGKNRFVNTAVSVLCVLFIMAMCGFTMSIMRAGLMFIIGAFAPLIYKENDSVNSLGMAVVLIHISSPFAIFSVAFQLSLLSTYAILVLSPEIMEIVGMRIKNFFALKVLEMLCITLSATFMTLPVAIYRFGYISYVAPVVNILITYAVSGALVIAIWALALNVLPVMQIVCRWLFVVCELLVRYINFVIKLFGRENAIINVGPWAVIPATVLVLSLLVLIKYCKYRRNLLKLKKLTGEGNLCL